MTESRNPDTPIPRQAAVDSLKDFAKDEARRLEEQAALAASQEKRKGLRTMIQWAVVVVCLGIIGYQLPKLVAALDPHEKPLRKGPMATDERTDRCIANLWQASKRLQENRPVGTDLVCPASGKPLVVDTVGDDVVVRSPRPDLYGFREMRVSRKKPVPELIR